MVNILKESKYVADKFAVDVKRNIRNIKRACKAISLLFKLAYKMVWGIIKSIIFALSHVTVFITIVAILISVYGVTVVILANELQFTLNPDVAESDELDLSALSEEERYIAMAKAVDRDLISDYYSKNTNGFQSWYDAYNITGNVGENPAMMLDMFLLINEIYSRPEINGEKYDTTINKVMVLGCSKLESQSVLTSGKRIFDSEITLNSNGYYKHPLGNDPHIWSNNTALNAGSGIGCTFVSEYEKSGIADEHRAILGGGGNIQANNAWYITEGALSRQDNMVSMGANDDVKKYLNTIRLNNGICSYRGFTSYMSDAFYNFAYTSRIVAEGRDRDTHVAVPSAYYAGGNASAVLELKDSLGITKEQAGTIMDMVYCGDRHFHSIIDALPNFENFDSLDSDIAGLAITVNATLYLEGYLDKIADEYNGKLSSIASYGNIAEKIYGDVSYGNGLSKINNITSDCYYMKCLEQLEKNDNDSGRVNFKYSEKWLNKFKSMKTQGPGLAYKLSFSETERLVRITYSACCYVSGRVYYSGLEKLAEACYNYQDGNGKYIFRTSNIDMGADNERINSGGRKGESGWVCPVDQKVSGIYFSSGYGDPNRDNRTNHFGSDISSPSFYGAELYAVKDGTIIFAGWAPGNSYFNGMANDGYGNSVLLDIGNDTVIRYGHGSEVKVKSGDKVKAGDLVMLAGSTGWSTGPHLHIEVLHPHKNNSYTIGTTNYIYASSGVETENPEKYLQDFFDVSYWYP